MVESSSRYRPWAELRKRPFPPERPPSLLVLDEPTNHLDLDALEALGNALRAYDGALLAVSHDREFLEAIGVDRYVELGREAPVTRKRRPETTR